MAVALAAVAAFVDAFVEVDGEPFEWGKGIDPVEESEEEEEEFWRLRLEIAAMALRGAFSGAFCWAFCGPEPREWED